MSVKLAIKLQTSSQISQNCFHIFVSRILRKAITTEIQVRKLIYWIVVRWDAVRVDPKWQTLANVLLCDVAGSSCQQMLLTPWELDIACGVFDQTSFWNGNKLFSLLKSHVVEQVSSVSGNHFYKCMFQFEFCL